jgi:gluconokinase
VTPRAPDDRAIVVIGVAGSGKSTIASALGRHLGREFRDGDSFHSADNLARMARGEPLASEDRIPWLDAITAWLAATPRAIVACSALTKSYRNRLRRAGPLLILYLEITPPAASRRVANRQAHFMPASLVDDQFATLEAPSRVERDVVSLDGEAAAIELVARALSVVSRGPMPNAT